MARLCYVVHRYAPYPGGSEYFVQHMAEESYNRGHDVTVFTNVHKGDLNGVKVTSKFTDDFDLVIVHGGDVPNQDWVHLNSENFRSPVLYQIIKPSSSKICLRGMYNADYLGWSTSFDLEHIKHHGYGHKAVRVRHGMNFDKRNGTESTFKDKYGINTNRMFVSAGGFYAHKQMPALALAFIAANLNDTTLVLLGYENGDIPASSHNIKTFVGLPEQDVADAIRGADLYIMNSTEEGFGLVLLEAMMNKTPWMARHIAGAADMAEYGSTYESEATLAYLMKNFKRNPEQIEKAYEYVMNNHQIKHVVNDIEAAIYAYN